MPEFLQEQVNPAALAGAVQGQLEDAARRAMLRARFRAIHETLRQGGAARAAEAVLQLRGAAA